MIIQVGKKNIKEYDKSYSYTDIKYLSNGWVDCKQYLPRNFDLVFGKNDKDKIFIVWYAGNEWDGFRLNNNVITHWKKKED